MLVLLKDQARWASFDKYAIGRVARKARNPALQNGQPLRDSWRNDEF